MASNKFRDIFYGPLSWIGLTVAFLTLLIDQIHKSWMIHIYKIGERQLVELTPFLNLVMVWNEGISYGLFQQDEFWGRFLLVIFAIAAVIGLTIWLARIDTKLSAISIGLIIGGALGNALDRAIYGAVADFFSFHAFGFYWYVFNIADVGIVAGVAGLLYDSLVTSRKKVSKAP